MCHTSLEVGGSFTVREFTRFVWIIFRILDGTLDEHLVEMYCHSKYVLFTRVGDAYTIESLLIVMQSAKGTFSAIAWNWTRLEFISQPIPQAILSTSSSVIPLNLIIHSLEKIKCYSSEDVRLGFGTTTWPISTLALGYTHTGQLQKIVVLCSVRTPFGVEYRIPLHNRARHMTSSVRCARMWGGGAESFALLAQVEIRLRWQVVCRPRRWAKN